MSDYLRTIFSLAEAADFYDDDEAEQARLDDISYQRGERERRFEKALGDKLRAMGVNVLAAPYAISYQEEERELTLKIDDELSFQQIQALASLGEVKISALQDEQHNSPYLYVEIATHEGLAIR